MPRKYLASMRVMNVNPLGYDLWTRSDEKNVKLIININRHEPATEQFEQGGV